MARMLGGTLRSERRFVCRFRCCTATRAHVKRKTKNERIREKRVWMKEELR